MTDEVRVLIADDNPDIRAMLRMRLDLDPRFAVVGEAEDGRLAVELVDQLRPDVVILDLAMPAMDGLEALPLIRSAHPTVKVAVLSGFGRQHLERQALALGADVYLDKDDSISALPDRIATLANSG